MTRYWSCPTHSLFLFPLFINIFCRNNLFLFSSLFRLLSSPSPLIFLTDTLFFFFLSASGQWQQLAGVLLFWVKVGLKGRKTLWRRFEMKKSQSVKTHQSLQMEARYINALLAMCVCVTVHVLYLDASARRKRKKRIYCEKWDFPLVLYWQETSVEFQYHIYKRSMNSGQQYDKSSLWSMCSELKKKQIVKKMDFYINCVGHVSISCEI